MAKLRGHPNILRLHAVAFAGPKGQETDGFFLLDYCVSEGGEGAGCVCVWGGIQRQYLMQAAAAAVRR